MLGLLLLLASPLLTGGLSSFFCHDDVDCAGALTCENRSCRAPPGERCGYVGAADCVAQHFCDDEAKRCFERCPWPHTRPRGFDCKEVQVKLFGKCAMTPREHDVVATNLNCAPPLLCARGRCHRSNRGVAGDTCLDADDCDAALRCMPWGTCALLGSPQSRPREAWTMLGGVRMKSDMVQRLEKMSLTYRGRWSGGAAYSRGDYVLRRAQLWICVRPQLAAASAPLPRIRRRHGGRGQGTLDPVRGIDLVANDATSNNGSGSGESESGFDATRWMSLGDGAGLDLVKLAQFAPIAKWCDVCVERSTVCEQWREELMGDGFCARFAATINQWGKLCQCSKYRCVKSVRRPCTRRRDV